MGQISVEHFAFDPRFLDQKLSQKNLVEGVDHGGRA
jgi:hypothetical protein